jgi:SOS-response transcriptional repressor LexA
MGKLLAGKIERLWRDAGLASQADLAKRAQIAISSFNYYASGTYKKETMPAEMVAKLEPVLTERGISRERVWQLSDVSAPSLKPIASSGIARLPYYGEVRAGHWGAPMILDGEVEEYVEIPEFTRQIHGYRDTFILQVSGTSMNQKFTAGTYLECVHPEQFKAAIKTGDYIICQRRNQWGEAEVTVKQLEIKPNGEHWLWPRSDDPEFTRAFKIPPRAQWTEGDSREITVVGIVVASYGSPVP